MRHAWIRTGAVLLTLAVVASCSDDDESAPTTASERTEPPTTLTADVPPVAVAMGFLNSYIAFDAERALTYLTDDAIAGMWWETPESFRLELALLEAQGYKETITGCEPPADSSSGTTVRCSYDFHAIRSDEMGLGPYSDNYWELTVRDGTIVSATNTIAFATNGFSQQMWEPFAQWVATTYPDDVPKMYTGGQTDFQLTEESIQLWEQRSREYVAEVGQTPGTGTSP